MGRGRAPLEYIGQVKVTRTEKGPMALAPGWKMVEGVSLRCRWEEEKSR